MATGAKVPPFPCRLLYHLTRTGGLDSRASTSRSSSGCECRPQRRGCAGVGMAADLPKRPGVGQATNVWAGQRRSLDQCWTAQARQPHSRPHTRLGFGEELADPAGEPRAAQAGPARAGPVGQGGDTVGVVAVDPAAHRDRVAAQRFGDGTGGPAALGQQDHDQAGRDPANGQPAFGAYVRDPNARVPARDRAAGAHPCRQPDLRDDPVRQERAGPLRAPRTLLD